jgi:hypothetical protein
MRLLIHSVLFATSLTVAACRDDAAPAQCQFVEHDIVDLNEEVDGIVPAEVIDVVTRPYRGELTWNGGGDYLEVTPARGTTGFTYQATFAGNARFMENPSHDPDDFLGCPSLLLLDLELAFQTEDGTLDEHWSAVGDVALSGFLPSLSIPLDVDETGILDALAISETTASLTRFTEREYLFGMTHHVRAEPPTLVGDLTFSGRAEPTMDGEIIDVSGTSVRIAEWAGAAYD